MAGSSAGLAMRPVSSLGAHVRHVLCLRSEKEVLGIYAPGVIAPMQNAQLWPFPVGNEPCHAVAQHAAVPNHTHASVSVPIAVPIPQPARSNVAPFRGGEPVHPAPQSRGDWRGNAPAGTGTIPSAPGGRKLFAAACASAHDDLAHGVISRGSGPGRVNASRGRFAGTLP